LLDRIKDNDALAWERLATLYTPIVYGWARRSKLPESEAADIVQDVFQAVATGISGFEYGPGSPRFRAWLWGITRHKVQDQLRRRANQPQAAGGTNAQQQLAHVPEESLDETSESWALSDTDPLAYRALALIKTDFQETTWRAFWLVTVEERAALDVAQELGLSVGAVYTAKSRVLAHLRKELEGLQQ